MGFPVGGREGLTPIAGEPAVGLEVGGKASRIVLSGRRARRQAVGGYHEIVFGWRRQLAAGVRRMSNPFTGPEFPILRLTGSVGVVPPAGLEPAAPRLGISCSIRLSYGGILDGSLLNTGASPCQLRASAGIVPAGGKPRDPAGQRPACHSYSKGEPGK